MATVIKAPTKFTKPDGAISVFLGGSIEMGAAENWQERLTKELSGYEDLYILNPRRDDWDSSWVQDPTPGTEFYEQVDWEIKQQRSADIIVYYFAAGTKSPITLLELGTFGYWTDTIVYCTPDFWRYGNVAMHCYHNEIRLFQDHDSFLAAVKDKVEEAIEAECTPSDLEMWEHHVVVEDNAVPKVAWCGAHIHPFEFRFIDVEHAKGCVEGNTWVQPCPACWEAITKNSA